MHEFFGLGTTHFTKIDEETGAKEILKLRVHSIMIKKVDGRPSVFWKEFMRDKIWLPEDGIGWPVSKPMWTSTCLLCQQCPPGKSTGLQRLKSVYR